MLSLGKFYVRYKLQYTNQSSQDSDVMTDLERIQGMAKRPLIQLRGTRGDVRVEVRKRMGEWDQVLLTYRIDH